MPRQYSMGGRAAPGTPPPSGGGPREPPPPKAQPKNLRERFSALRNLPPFLRDLWATSPTLLTSDLVLRVLRALLPVATLFVGKLIIDEVVELLRGGAISGSLHDALASGRFNHLALLLGYEFVLAVLSDLFGRVVSLLDALLSEKYTNATSIRLMQHAATLDLEDFEDSEMQDRLERARRQAVGRSSLMGQLFGQAQDLVTVVAFAAGLVVYAPWLMLLLAVALVPAFLGEAHFNAQSYSLNFAWTAERRVLDYLRQTGASAETAKEVKIFGLNAFLIERYRALSEGFYAANRSLAKRRALWGSAFAALGTVGYYVAYALIAWRTVHGEFSIGDLTFLSGSFRRLRNLLENLLIGFSQLAGQALYLDDLYSFFEVQPEIVSPANPRPFPSSIGVGFTFDSVGFRYPGAERWAVRELTFTLQAGEVLALVGENGAGKTTLVKLLCKLYEPTVGRILVDGRPLAGMDAGRWRSRLAGAFQDFFRFELRARHSVGVGDLPRLDDEPAVAAAVGRAGAGDVVDDLAAGLDTQLGPTWPQGVEVSFGQWQKLALARGFMRTGPLLLVLDEPTAALDAETEHALFERYARAARSDAADERGRVMILVSHRFSTVRMADLIVVLDGSRVTEVGSHEELMRLDGQYASLYETQASSYR